MATIDSVLSRLVRFEGSCKLPRWYLGGSIKVVASADEDI